jgi:alpha-1,2-glucosyltransferase
MDAPTAASHRRLRFALAIAVLVLLDWYGVVCAVLPRAIGDERQYQPTICDLVLGDTRSLRIHSITPTWLVVCGQLATVVGTSITSLRGIAAAAGVSALLIMAGASWTRDPRTAPERFTCLALHPLLVQMWVLFYSDLPALAAILLAAWAAQARRHTWAALAALLAVLIRQSNLVWLAMFAVLAADAAWDARAAWSRRLGRALAAALPYGVAMLVAAALIWCGWLRILPDPFNGPRFNRAQFYFFGLVAALVWLPVWLPALRRASPVDLWPRAVRPLPCSAFVAGVALLVVAFANPHAGNVDYQWLRNRPLVALDQHVAVRIAAMIVLALFGITWALETWRSPQRRRRCIWLAASLLFLGPHFLVEPRYYMIPLILADVFAERSAQDWSRLVRWYGLLSAGIVAYTLLYPGGGLL